MARWFGWPSIGYRLGGTKVDLAEPTGLQVFINESEVSLLGKMIWNREYIDTEPNPGSFQLLRPTNLIRSRRVREYRMGKRQRKFDLVSRNEDATRMPYVLHSENATATHVPQE